MALAAATYVICFAFPPYLCQRAQLMNGLLLMVASHFPLEEVDILGAFASFEGPELLGVKRYSRCAFPAVV
ncbi:MAG: hypothetical protein U9R48_04865 [Chloroflexota bacterium]|nr:hypothetical protein [Chloroflexota bacterium]